jgi:RND family efflux transporter MFP subunit
MAVEAITLQPSSVERTTEYVGTLKSRRSTTIQPQVEGFITRIHTRAGARVGTGAVLMEIDAGRQQAAVSSLESVRAARQSDVALARQQAARAKSLLDVGAISQAEYEQADAHLKSTQAQLGAIEAQIREQRVELGYHRVTSPAAGVVGDIPVRVGDRVTRQTVLTTVDAAEGLELNVNVPVQQATGLKLGLPIRVIDDEGQVLATLAVGFIAASVDEATQSVLVKAPVITAGRLRADQFVRARIIWNADAGLTVPLVSAVRINGQHFVFIAEESGGKTVARQRAVELGPVVGNDYIVVAGLKPGEKLIVSGIQKIGDGSPVSVKK